MDNKEFNERRHNRKKQECRFRLGIQQLNRAIRQFNQMFISLKESIQWMKIAYGRLIKMGTNTQFYLYAVCDITSKLRKIAEDFDFIETPDKRGMYKYHDKKRAYIEILSFDKIIDDAGKRNRILFEKLGI